METLAIPGKYFVRAQSYFINKTKPSFPREYFSKVRLPIHRVNQMMASVHKTFPILLKNYPL